MLSAKGDNIKGDNSQDNTELVCQQRRVERSCFYSATSPAI